MPDVLKCPDRYVSWDYALNVKSASLLSPRKFEIRCPNEVDRVYIHYLNSPAIKVR